VVSGSRKKCIFGLVGMLAESRDREVDGLRKLRPAVWHRAADQPRECWRIGLQCDEVLDRRGQQGDVCHGSSGGRLIE